MALKDLFGKTTEQVLSNKQLDTLYKEAESTEYVEKAIEDKERFLPPVDFYTSSNFARYGSAEKYYVDAIKNVYENYPYDGSRSQIQEWRNASSQLDLFILDKIYPKTTGYVNLDSVGTLSTLSTYRSASSPQFIKVIGGPNASVDGNIENANIYDPSKNLESNLAITSLGNTIEFWFKDNLTASNSNYTSSYALFDLWNEVTASSNGYTRLAITKIDGQNKFSITYRSGSAGITSQTLDYVFDSSTWHHYAFTFRNINTNDLEVSLYVDGDLMLNKSYSSVGQFNLANNYKSVAYIGALRADIIDSSKTKEKLGVSCGAFDELRFWKNARTSQQIYRNWFTQVAGGSNTDEANADLGVYLKFNEGIINTGSINEIDKICLDSSGRVSNGIVVNYNLSVRNTGSAIDEYFYKTDINGNQIFVESKDPIIFSTNPLVQQILLTYSELGAEHDNVNVSSVYSMIPSWIVNEVDKSGISDLPNLVQMIASYFDSLHIQIEALSKIKFIDYDSSYKPKPFAKNLLNSSGFDNIEILNDTTFLEHVLGRSEKEKFKDNIHNIKNAIYQNIYNNLSYIYKSKGTEKSLRNLIRCFGIDDELLKINLYANNSQYELKTSYTHASVPKKFVDFNNPNRYKGYIYQRSNPSDVNSKAYIPSHDSASFIPLTVEAEIIFPKRPIIESTENSYATFLTSSLYGVHEALTCPDEYEWGYNDVFNFQVYSIKESIDNPHAYFKATGSFNGYGFSLTSSLYKDVYDNEKWNFAVRIKPTKYEQINLTSESDITDYTLEFVGINSIGDTVHNQFALSTIIPQAYMTTALQTNKRVYAGAHYYNFNPNNLLTQTDVKIGSVKFWLDYLNNEELLAHSFETNNYGRQQPNWPPAYLSSLNVDSFPITRADTLALHWNFYNVSSTDTNGQFTVTDISSGSLAAANYYGLKWLNEIIHYQMPGFADLFTANDSQVVNREYVFSAKKQIPETLGGNDLIQIVDADDVTRTKDSQVINYFIAIEKSMAQVINDEMLNWFATIKSFNNLIGQPVDRYKQEYTNLNHLRELFFERVNSSLDFEKFFNFYKWIDGSLSTLINQLIPASADSTNKIRNVIESHVLERSKYENKLPALELKAHPKSYPIVSHLTYNYAEQTANSQNNTEEIKISRYYNFKPQWYKQRAIRTEAPANTILEPQNDIDREILRQVINEKNIDSLPKLYSVENATQYEGRRDVSRVFTNTYNLSADRLYILEDSIIPVTIQNTPVSSRFIFANQISVSSSADQIVPAYQKYNKRGNYQHTYETVMLSGRAANNKSFVALEGAVGDTVFDSNLQIANRLLPNRKTVKTVIVERFSAPGGAEVNSRGYLDAAAEEYSVYNSINYRNSRVRKVLNAWLKESGSIDTENPSYHKINKNPSYSPNPETGLATADYDNWFIQHQIPQSDAQYSWITASLAVKPSASVFVSNFDNLFNSSSLQFLSGTSQIDYVGLNTTIVKGIDASTNTLSASQQVSDLNKYLSNINGPYNWPSWKQIRNIENKIVISSRKNNNISIQDIPSEKTRIIDGYKESYFPKKELTFTTYKEPPVAYNKPMKHTIAISGSPNLVELKSTYDNNIERFANDDLITHTGIGDKTDQQTHDLLVTLENEEIYAEKPDVKKIEYETNLYPSKQFIGLKEARSRQNYEDWVDNTGSIVNARTYWRNNETERARAETTKDIYNFTDTTYTVLPTQKIFNIYNEAINYINAIKITSSNGFRESLYSLDLKKDFFKTQQSYLSDQSLNLIAYINNDKEIFPISDGLSTDYQLPNLPYATAYSILSASEGIYVAWLAYAQLGTVPANKLYLTKWNGKNWSILGGGLNSAPTAIISASDGLYVGGYFTYAYNLPGPINVPASYIAKWNGSAWSALSGGLNGIVRTIISASDGLYVGGDFTSASNSSNIPANRIAKWNGNVWSALSGGLNGSVYTLAYGNDSLYVGGDFTSASNSSNISANYIAKWKAAWSTLSGGLSYPVYAVASASNGLYAGGRFLQAYNASPVTTNYIAKWNGNVWSALSDAGGNGVADGQNSVYGTGVETLAVKKDKLYVGGNFNTASNISLRNIAIWNLSSSTWSSAATPGGGVNNVVFNISAYDNGIYIAGIFDSLGDIKQNINTIYYSNLKGDLTNLNSVESSYYTKNNITYNFSNIAKYDITNNNIYNINNNIKDSIIFSDSSHVISASLSCSDGLYVGGYFTSINGTASNNLAKWDGSTWTPIVDLFYNLDGHIKTIASGNDGIYIGGNFTNSILRWDGIGWNSISFFGDPVGTVNAIYSASNGIYIGGSFTDVGHNVAFFNGGFSGWNSLPNSALDEGLSGPVHSIISTSNGIYFGGNFESLYTSSYSTSYKVFNLARWDGTVLSSSLFGYGVNGPVYSLLSASNGIYAGGRFGISFTGLPPTGITVNGIAKWNGSSWSALGNGLTGNSNSIYTLASGSNGLYVGGDFLKSNTLSLNAIARWDGTSWNAIGRSGIRNGFNLGYTDTIYSININNTTNEAFVAGYFTGTKSGPLIKDNNFNNYIEAFDTNKLLMPVPSLVHNNFIPPSLGNVNGGMKINEITYDNKRNITNINTYTGSEKISILNENYVYEIEKRSGKAAFFNTYLDYLGDLKYQTQKYSIVPEYTISDYVEEYIKQKNGNFNSSLNKNYLKLDGAAKNAGYEDVNNSFNTTNAINTNLIFDNTKNNENISVTLKISGLKKLIPYRDFYPSERIVKLGSYFINSFLDLNTQLTSVLNSNEVYSSSLSNNTPINQQILTLLQPIMAPGILLNTIKSSVAVDWPTFITNSVLFDSQEKPIFYANTGSELVTNYVYDNVNNKQYAYTASNYIDQQFNYRFPFESLIEFDTLIPQELVNSQNNLYYLNPTYYTSDAVTGSDMHLLSYPSYNMGTGSLKPFVFRDANYKLAMHNFLAEIPNFFMNGKLSNIVSLPEKKFKAAKAGVKYYMDVVLERDSKFKEFIADPYYEGLKAQTQNFYNSTLLLPSPDSLYGPPVRYWKTINADSFYGASLYNIYSKLLDTPSYAPYVPPYYYGKAIARISFTATENKKYSLTEIQSSCSVEYINTELDNLFLQRSNFISGNFTGSFADNYSTSPAYKDRMNLSASLNLFLASDTKLTKFDPNTAKSTEISDGETINPSWIIQTKFETPSINFINSDLTENIGLKFLGGTKDSGSVKGIYSYMMKGLWTTYGEPVKNGSGIKLYLQESYNRNRSSTTGSLIDLCGFGNALQKKTIGLLAEKKTIKEGVVIIPYTFDKNHEKDFNQDYAETIPEINGENGIYFGINETNRGPYYYKLDKNIISKLLGNINFDKSTVEQIRAAAESSVYKNNSIVKLILSMTNYVIPPHLDWLRDKDIQPFVMYIADFSTVLDKQDLSDIWQGLMPKASYNGKFEDIRINHNFVPDEPFHGKRPQNDTKFKIFKVKQRANINYYKLTDDSRDDTRFQFKFGNSQEATIPEYSYNWPYDYFSLVELVNIEAKLVTDDTIPVIPQVTVTPNKIIEALADPNREVEIKKLSVLTSKIDTSAISKVSKTGKKK